MPSVEKEIMLKEIVDRTKDQTVFFSNFNRLTVEEVQDFRKSVRGLSAKSFVVKKTLIKKYFSDLGAGDISSLLENNVVVTAVDEEPQKVSKLLVKYEKDQEDKFKLTGAYVDGELKDKKFVVALSKLPSREQLIARLLGTMQAPVTNLALTLNAVVRNFAVVLNEIKKQKETGAAPSE